MEHSVPISDLPFNVHAFESRYGKIRSAEKLCPGVFRILTVPIPLDQFICSDLFVGMADSPAIPLTAKSYGIPLESSPEVLVVYCNADYFDKSRWVMTYEIDKYLVDHNFPLPDGESLLEVRVRGMEVCPEYFGEFPIPTETPWGAPLQHDRLANGVFWLRTEKAGWVLALAYPICDSLLPETVKIAVLNPYDRENGIDKTCGFRFFKYEQSCLPLFQLLNCAQQPWSDRINTAALQNAVLYAREYNKNCIEADQIAELRHTPSAGTCYYLFPAEDA